MKICLEVTEFGQTALIMPVSVFTGSALPIQVSGIRDEADGSKVVSVTVKVTNADGLTVTGNATKVGLDWYVMFSASNFAAYGTIKRGVRIIKTVKHADDSTDVVTVAIGDLVVEQATANAQPGTGGGSYVSRGEDIYFKTQVVEGVQHYTKQVMAYDAQIGWGAEWQGDYILVDGEYQEVNQ